MQPHIQAITLQPASVSIQELNAALVGSTDTSVLRMEGTPVVVGTAITPTTTAANGTIFAITQRGLYEASLIGFVAAADGTAYGVSKNATGSVLTTAPSVLQAGMLEAATVLPAAASGPVIKLAVTFAVTGAEAAAAGGALIRFHAQDDTGGTPPAEINLDSLLVRVTRLADYLG